MPTLTTSECRALIQSARNRAAGKPLQNNTRLFERWAGSDSPNAYAVRLHNTDVVTVNPDHTWTLNSGGWRTMTTRDRIESYSPVRIIQDRGEWYVRVPSPAEEPTIIYNDVDDPKLYLPYAGYSRTEPEPHEDCRRENPDTRYGWTNSYCPVCAAHDGAVRKAAKARENIARYGSAEEWAEARRQRQRERNASLKAHRAWNHATRIPFRDGMVVDSDGLPVSQKLAPEHRGMRAA